MPRVDHQVTEFLNPDEMGRLLDTLDKWPFKGTAALIKFALYTGLRRGELLKLTWDYVDFERSMITLRDPKGGKTQTLPIRREALDALKSLEVNSSFVFPGKDGRQKKEFYRPWERIRQAAKLPGSFRFHGLIPSCDQTSRIVILSAAKNLDSSLRFAPFRMTNSKLPL